MDRLAVFAKWPAPGRVKTRLSPGLPAALACEIYRALLEDTLELAAAAGTSCSVYWADAPESLDAPRLPPGLLPCAQRGLDLGARLASAFDELLQAPGDRAVVIGADCPALEAATLRVAFDALLTHDAAIGPTRDGGYYLIGLARRAPGLFRDVEWSTGRVLDQTLERARAARVSVRRLEPLEDLDTPEDLVRWLARVAAGRAGGARRLNDALRGMGLLPARP